MKRVVLGTAGHVDHGKTSLIKALTGTDCDRLAEEKRRGLTIELGFAALDLPSGERVSVVDVPGHVRFIHHMLSGASGIDLVLLVVAADEGVMPQTAEHVRICELLGIRRGVIALTKTDMVDEELRALAEADVREFTAGTFLEDAPLIPVSAVSGDGLDQLKAVLEHEVAEAEERAATGIPRLGIDRVFSIKGFGTVATGTLVRGSFAVGDEVEIQPAGLSARIRTLQVHGHDEERAQAGMRTAVNLQGVSVDEIERGQWLVPAGTATPTRVFDARLDLVETPRRGGIRVHMGTAEAIGTMTVHEVHDQRVARIRLKTPVICSAGDHCIIRSISPARTIAGGTVLNPSPRRRFSADIAAMLLDEEESVRLQGLVLDAGFQGISRRALGLRLGDLGARTGRIIGEQLSRGALVRFDAQHDLLVSAGYFSSVKQRIMETVTAFHHDRPSDPGMAKELLRSRCGAHLDQRLFHKALQELTRAGQLAEEGPLIMATGFEARLGTGADDLAGAVRRRLEQSIFEPPRVAELAEEAATPLKELKQVLAFLEREQAVYKIKEDIYLSAAAEKQLKHTVDTFLAEHGELKPSDMKDLFRVSRKYAIPYLEYLDRTRFTVRVGDIRRRGSGS